MTTKKMERLRNVIDEHCYLKNYKLFWMTNEWNVSKIGKEC